MSVVIETTVGDITVDLYVKERPNTCLNFLKLCKVKFYNFCIFYKIEKNFIAQAGDPTATGRGGESIFCRLYGDQAKYFDAEFKPRLKHEKLGTLSMVNNGNNMNGSQFFITLSENLTYLDENHSVFGEVAEGFDVLLKLNDAICDNNSRPYQDIRITHTVILHDPFEDPQGLEIPDASPEPTKEMLETDYIAPDEEIDDTKGKTAEEIEEKIKESEAKARATILEMVGDIPDAEVKPPENVLFVCKLNPVTTAEDLEVIFSRFGKILSCEVIKDKKTGESLQYAFIEFEREEDCEAAYFKMDNVLIDDRRIHVDFSQSVSKLYFNRGKMPKTKEAMSNFSVKNTGRNDGGYDLIFDNEDDNMPSDRRSKSKSDKLSSKHKSSSKKPKDYSHEEKKRTNQEDSYSDRKHKDSKYYKSNSKRESHKYRESDDYYSSNKNETYKGESHRTKENQDRTREKDRSRENIKDRSRESIKDRSRERENDRSKEREKDRIYKSTYTEHSYSPERKNPDHRSDSKYTAYSSSVSHKYSKNYRKSPESYSQRHKTASKTSKNSESPEQPKKHYEKYSKHMYDKARDYDRYTDHSHNKSREYSYGRSKEQLHHESSKKKHSSEYEDEEYSEKHRKKHPKYKDSVKISKDSKSGTKMNTLSKSKKSRSSSVSSSSSSSSSSSASSSSSKSDSSSSPSPKNKRKHHEKKRNISDSHKVKPHKKGKYSS